MFCKVLEFKDVNRTNIHADTIAIALGPVNLDFGHFCLTSIGRVISAQNVF